MSRKPPASLAPSADDNGGSWEMLGWVLLGLIGVILLTLFAAGIRIAQEYQRGVVFRLGRFKTGKGPGLYTVNPV